MDTLLSKAVVEKMDVNELVKFLKKNGFKAKKIERQMKAQHIDGATLLELNENELRKVGFNTVGLMHGIQRLIKNLNDPTASQSSSSIFKGPFEVKICMIGDSETGKTSIASRFVNKSFLVKLDPTLGVAFFMRKVETVNGCSYQLQIWDTGGQERFHGITALYYQHASVIVIVFDVTRRSSFMNIVNYWIKEIDEKRRGEDEYLLILVGNKVDLNVREVSKNEAQNFADEIGAWYYETSAKLDDNIENIFMDVCSYFEANGNRNLNICGVAGNSTIRLHSTATNPTKKTKGCCK